MRRAHRGDESAKRQEGKAPPARPNFHRLARDETAESWTETRSVDELTACNRETRFKPKPRIEPHAKIASVIGERRRARARVQGANENGMDREKERREKKKCKNAM